MAIRTVNLPLITAVGSAGSATATTTQDPTVNGLLLAIKVVQGNSPHANTDVTVSISDGTVTQTLLTLTNNNTASAWYYPRALVQGIDGVDLTSQYTLIPMDGRVTGLVAQGGSAATCQITIRYAE